MIPASVMQQVAAKVRDDVAARMRANDQVATGKTLAALRPEGREDVARLFAPAHIGALETGVSPSTKYTRPGKAYVASIKEWAEARKIVIKGGAYALARSILLKGTRLHRGEDPRFSGKPRTFTGLFTASYIGDIRVLLGTGARPAIRSEVLKALKLQ